MVPSPGGPLGPRLVQVYGLDGTRRADAYRIEAIHSPDPGTVWTVAHVAARDWRSGVGARIERPDGYVGYELDGDALYDSVLELWDLAGRRVLVSHRVPAQLQGFLSNDLLWAWRQDALGIPYVDVWRLTLRGGP